MPQPPRSSTRACRSAAPSPAPTPGRASSSRARTRPVDASPTCTSSSAPRGRAFAGSRPLTVGPPGEPSSGGSSPLWLSRDTLSISTSFSGGGRSRTHVGFVGRTHSEQNGFRSQRSHAPRCCAQKTEEQKPRQWATALLGQPWRSHMNWLRPRRRLPASVGGATASPPRETSSSPGSLSASRLLRFQLRVRDRGCGIGDRLRLPFCRMSSRPSHLLWRLSFLRQSLPRAPLELRLR